MNTPEINPHLSTTNIYVKRNIIAENCKRMSDYVKTPEYRKLGWHHRQEFCIELTNQRRLLSTLDKKIAELEQLSFPFGSILP